LSPFQEAAVLVVEREHAGQSFTMDGRHDRYLATRLSPSGNIVYIYRDGAALKGITLDWRFERWDYDSPDQLLADLAAKLRELR
jgi:hypothetical protein